MMKINKIIISALVFVGFIATSCESWLDVSPRSEVKAEDLFSQESGYRDALFGVYTSMSKSNLYGSTLTMSLMDVLAQTYVINTEGQAFYDASKYDYETIEPTINGIWRNMYSCISNCNNLLENLEGNEDVFQDDNYDIFVAEAKALRAYLHFDLLRMFAPSATSSPDYLSIPFIDKVATTPFPQLTTTEMLDKVISELTIAQDLLREIDPIGPAFDTYNRSTYLRIWDQVQDGGFLINRTNRMNYYSVTALLARVYMYMGNTADALEAANEVINSGKFSFVSEDDLVGADKPDILFNNEIIFGVYNEKIFDISKNYFKFEAGSELRMPDTRKHEYFETDVYGNVDYRARYQFGRVNNSSDEYVVKYSPVDYYNPYQVPLLRLSEMFYIAAECTANDMESLSIIDSVRVNRGYSTYPDSLVFTPEDIEMEIYKEYRKEFIAEGQMFYYLKRKGIVDIKNTIIDGSDMIYVFPIPDVEIEFGNIK